MECFLELFCIYISSIFISFFAAPLSKRVEERKEFRALVQGHAELVGSALITVIMISIQCCTLQLAFIAQQPAQKCWTSAAVCDCNLRHQIWFKSIMQRRWRFHFFFSNAIYRFSPFSACCCCDVVVYIRKKLTFSARFCGFSASRFRCASVQPTSPRCRMSHVFALLISSPNNNTSQTVKYNAHHDQRMGSGRAAECRFIVLCHVFFSSFLRFPTHLLDVGILLVIITFSFLLLIMLLVHSPLSGRLHRTAQWLFQLNHSSIFLLL